MSISITGTVISSLLRVAIPQETIMAILDQQEAGVLAALAAPFCMAVGFIVWDNTWKTSSAFSLNLFKYNLASVIFLISRFVFGFSFNEEKFRFDQVGWLVLSGMIGIIIGDLFWLEALRRLGAFQVLVIDTIKPFCAALLGHLILGETIHSVAYVGIVMTVGGVLVVSEEQDNKALQKTTLNRKTTTAMKKSISKEIPTTLPRMMKMQSKNTMNPQSGSDEMDAF
jgi:drug/metabolite transporter (DMT)-like permease